MGADAKERAEGEKEGTGRRGGGWGTEEVQQCGTTRGHAGNRGKREGGAKRRKSRGGGARAGRPGNTARARVCVRVPRETCDQIGRWE